MMKILTLFLSALLLFSSCDKRHRNKSNSKNQQNSSINTLYLQSPVYRYTRIDSLNKKPITFYLNHPEMNPLLRDIYFGKILPRYSQLSDIYQISLKSPEILQPFFMHLSNYISSTTQIEQNILQSENEKNRMQRNRDKLRVDSIDHKPISYYLNNPLLDSLIRDYYNGELIPSDDKNTFRLLDLLIEKKTDLYPFYFHCLTQICKDSDGALSEVMGPYCIQMILNYPKGAFLHFESDSLDLDKYASFIGYELYFKGEGTSDLTVNYEDFNNYLTKHLDLKNKRTKSSYDLFFTKINEVIDYMGKGNIPKDSLDLMMK